MAEPKLSMSFDPHTIEHLGIKMYSRLPNAMAELIANAYDADARNVHINIVENGSERSISVEDDGIGMTFDEINEKFLRIRSGGHPPKIWYRPVTCSCCFPQQACVVVS